MTYGELAELIGDRKKARAVGQAANRNPLAIVIPCHRVIGSNGRLVGYGGGLDKKEQLLRHESGGGTG
jgi:methylated-DNA-[protein]-cysteine S-methyltransferase